MHTPTEAPRDGQLVRLNPATLHYEPTAYVVRHHAPDLVWLALADAAEPALQLRLPHPEVLTEVAPGAFAYDPPLSDAEQACLARLVDAALAAPEAQS